MATADGAVNIRVNQPSDLIALEPGHALIPETWQSARANLTTEICKAEGNKAIAAKRYAEVLVHYDRGLDSCEDDETSTLTINQSILLGSDIHLSQSSLTCTASVLAVVSCEYVGN